jgi:hypothetical protein
MTRMVGNSTCTASHTLLYLALSVCFGPFLAPKAPSSEVQPTPSAALTGTVLVKCTHSFAGHDLLVNQQVSRFPSNHFLSFDFSKSRPERAILHACRLSIESRTT